MNWINTVVPLDQVEDVTMEWAETCCKKPIGFCMIKASMNADTDGLAGINNLLAMRPYCITQWMGSKEGRDAFKEKRQPNFDQFLNSLNEW